jgi:hypothetical protein
VALSGLKNATTVVMVMSTVAVAEPMLDGSSAEVVAAVVKFWQDYEGSRASREGGGGREDFIFCLPCPRQTATNIHDK